MNEKQRTAQQNKALHKWYTMVAEQLNSAGLDMKKFLKPAIEIPWTTESVKNHIWRPVQEVMVDKTSTADLTTTQVKEIWEVLNLVLAKKGLHIPFPTLDEEPHEELSGGDEDPQNTVL